MTSEPARIVLHADDLGMNRAVTDGILQGFRQGLLTSTSLLTGTPNAERALKQWKLLAAEQQAGELPSAPNRRRLDDPAESFDLGVHLNLTQGRPLTGSWYPPELLDAEGRFPGVFRLYARLRRSGDRFCEPIQAELEHQIRFLRDHGLRPTHLNGHQYVEMMPTIATLIPPLLKQFGIASVRVAHEPALFRSTVLCGLRVGKWSLGLLKRFFASRFRSGLDALGIAHPDAFHGTVHAGGIDMRLMRLFLGSAKNRRLVEIGLHPGRPPQEPSADESRNGWADPLALCRPNELRLLLSTELVAEIEAQGLRLGRLAT